MAKKDKNISESNDKTYVKKPEIHYSYKFQPYIRDLGGSPGKNMTQEDRNKRLQRENNVNAVRNVARGLNNTFGTAISGASLFYGGGWALNRLLHLNKASSLGQFFGRYALPANTADNVSDGVELIFNPSVEGAVDLGSGVVLGRFKDLSKPVRQVGELIGQGANINNMKNGGLIRKMQTAAGGPIDYKKWDNRKITSYTIPFIKEKAIKLTNAGRATGAVLSTNLLDSLADNAIRAGVPIRTAIGISTKESTLGNPTDDRSAWNISSKIRKLFNGVYPGTVQHINNGTNLVNGINLINYHKGNIDHEMFNGAQGKSIIQEGLEFYKTHPNKYNPGLKGYQKAVDSRGKEVMNSPEVLKWYREWERSKAQIFRPEPYKINTNIQNTAQEFVSRNKQGGKMNILEFLKNGSGIHIKKKNRGKFRLYCGGEVTDSCIKRAKASGNPTLVKRAVFALNSRKWKHKKGGKAFVNGVSILDSNPDAYKLVKKKVKMRLLGGMLDTTIINESPITLQRLNWLQLLSNIKELLRLKELEEKLILALKDAETANRIGLYALMGLEFLNTMALYKSNKAITNTSSPTISSNDSKFKLNNFWSNPSLSNGNMFNNDNNFKG